MTGERDVPTKLAVLVTCHNRRDTTERGLSSLLAQSALLREDLELRVFLVDDGSSDGTGAMASALDPRIDVIQGSGDLFWCGGMALAHRTARAWAPDLYLWLNDDIILYPDTLELLLSTQVDLVASGCGSPVVGGTIWDEAHARRFGGGGILTKRLFSYKIEGRLPQDRPERVNCIAGSLLLVPAPLLDTIDPFTDSYHHGRADLEFAFQAEAQGASVWLVPGYVADGNKPRAAYHQEGISLVRRVVLAWRSPLTRWRILDLIRFNRRVGGWRWPLWTMTYYLRRWRYRGV